MNVDAILIVGGGIGGLTLASLLAQAGQAVTVVEQADTPADIGAGIQLGPNAMQVLDRLGLKSSLESRGFLPRRAVLRDYRTDRALLTTPLNPESHARYGQNYLNIHRADLIDELLACAQEHGAVIEFGQAASEVISTSGGVTVRTDQQTFSAPLVVGADGIHSIVKSVVSTDPPARFTGQTAWRALIPSASLPSEQLSPDAHVWLGPGGHLVAYYLRGGERVNVVAVTEQDEWQQEQWQTPGDLGVLKAQFAGWSNTVQTLLDRCEQCFHWGLFDRPVAAQWYRERVVLLGDACHPMLPFMAQGAAMAIEDAWALVDSLLKAPPESELSDCLARYQRRRQSRTAAVQERSNRNAQTYHEANPVRVAARNAGFALASRWPALAYRVLDPIYGVDVTRPESARS